MSTADYGKAALGGPGGPHDELIQRALNELLRSPLAGTGPGLNLAGPPLGGVGLSPGTVTTSSPKKIEPTATLSAMPTEGHAPESATASLASAAAPQPSYGDPSVGGAGVSPGAVSTTVPKQEPTATQAGVPGPALGETDPLDALAASALGGPIYTGPSLGGVGTSPGIGVSPSLGSLGGSPGIGAAPSLGNGGPSAGTQGSPSPSSPGVGASSPGIGAPGSPTPTAVSTAAPAADPVVAYTPTSDSNIEALDAEIPGDVALQALLAPLFAVPSAPGVPRVPGVGGVQVPASGEAVRSLPEQSFEPFPSAHPAFDVNLIRRDFPILEERVNGRKLIWLDNAATTQKPRAVIDRLSYFYEHENSNIHRAAHELAARSTEAYENARRTVARFLGASSADEIVFVRGATEAINLAAAAWGGPNVTEGDEIVLTHLEHHANIVPWQQLCLAKGAKLRVAPVDDTGQVILSEYGKLLGPKTRIVAFPQVSNALGTVTPAKTMIEMAHRVGAKVLLDGAQSVSHMPVNVQELDADFFVLSGHKLFAPTGIGVLYGKKELLDAMVPYQTGGNMIQDVTFERTVFHGAPQRFEAGTGNIADAVGLGAAIDYVERIGMDAINHHEHGLIEYATKLLKDIPGLTIIGTAPEKAGVISFVLKGIPTEQVGARLNKYGIAVRSGHHCAQPILRRFGQETTVRPSFAFYNTCGEIDTLAHAVRQIASETRI